jgi:hypothetical protein
MKESGRLRSSSRENQGQEVFLQANTFLCREVFELNAHTIRPESSDHSRS